MTVYIVWFNNFNGDDEFQGVFSTEENAQSYINRFSAYDSSSMRIEETTLDSY